MKIVPSSGARAVALTGVESFIGRNLVSVLADDPRIERVVVFDVERPQAIPGKVRFYSCDLTRPGVEATIAEALQTEGVDTVVHAGFLESPTHATAWAHEMETVGTMQLLNACREAEIPNYVHWSQTALYGARRENPNYLTEESPLRGISGSKFLADKIDAEKQAQRFRDAPHEPRVTVLRVAPIIGPTVQNFVTTWLSRRVVPTLMGFDPLLQAVHEIDAIAAFKLAVDRPVPGTFNIVGDGVLPLSTVVRLAGRLMLPMPYRFMRRVTAASWAARVSEAPPRFIDYLRYLCVADGAMASEQLGFRPAYSTREAVLDFVGALRLREARLLQEAM